MTIAVVGARIFDGSGADPIPDGVVLIGGGRIAAVQSARSISLPPAAERLDATGYTVLPGIVDCHVHSTYRARDMRQHLLNTPTYNILKSVEILRETLACGVTTARGCGGADVGFRAAIEAGAIEGPRLLVSILMISQTGGARRLLDARRDAPAEAAKWRSFPSLAVVTLVLSAVALL